MTKGDNTKIPSLWSDRKLYDQIDESLLGAMKAPTAAIRKARLVSASALIRILIGRTA